MKTEAAIQLIEHARRTNAERDAMERKAGFAPPDQGGDQPAAWMRTIILALWAGISSDDLNALAEGLCMLVDLEQRTRGTDGAKFEPWKANTKIIIDGQQRKPPV